MRTAAFWVLCCGLSSALAAAKPDGLVLVDALKRGDHSTLETLLAPHVRADDRRSETNSIQTFATFAIADERLGPRFDAWIAAHPDSVAARLARAEHLRDIAWKHRGGGYSTRTHDQRLEQFALWYARAVSDYEAAVARQPASAPAHVGLIFAARDAGEDCVPRYQAARTALPDSVRVVMAFVACFEPRWGGDLHQLRAFIDDLKTRHPNDRELSIVVGYPYAWAGYQSWLDGKHADALAYYKQALARGEYSPWHAQRAEIYLRREQYALALEEADAALALYPDSASALAIRGSALAGLDRREEAEAVLRRAGALDWAERDVIRALDNFIRPPMTQAWAAYKEGRNDESLRLASGIAELAPHAAEAHFLAGWSAFNTGKRKDAERFMSEAIRLVPNEQRYVVGLDRFLAPQGRWDEIVAAWDVYLRYVPEDAEGYFERSGTHWNRGDRTAALADARKACSLGRKMGCLYAARMWTTMAVTQDD